MGFVPTSLFFVGGESPPEDETGLPHAMPDSVTSNSPRIILFILI
jgi:hypothetical protein